jgi:glycogen debranching enzyme
MFNIYNNGKPSPMGYSQTLENGLKISNFALFSSAADAIELCLFRDGKESRFAMSRTDNIWHIAIEGVKLNDEYAFRITGKNDRTLANPQKLILDPYAKAVSHKPDLSCIDKSSRRSFCRDDNDDKLDRVSYNLGCHSSSPCSI